MSLDKIWFYRHLLLRLVRRDFLIHHQQTILGPLWIVFQPFIMLMVYMVIFDQAVGLSTDGIPPALFYLSGIILWTLFSECFNGTAFTFIQNGPLFAKVYFPRVIIPLSIVVGNYIRFGIQFLLFFCLALYINADYILVNPLKWIATLLVSTVAVSLMGLGLGMVFSILTAKYRDLVNVIHMIVRLMMFATPVIYPLGIVEPYMQKWLTLNPLCTLFELFRFGFFEQGVVSLHQLAYSFGCMAFLVVIGSMLFNKFNHKLQDVI